MSRRPNHRRSGIGALGPGRVASRTPDHPGAGAGSANRPAPSGGAAYGMSQNTPALPRTVPEAVWTRSDGSLTGTPPSP
ncbi:MAG: hypothetical protein QOG96_4093 [Pseudonocardiales bacterium]|jgi:hypothetical protein|nr:hypothetical protein [Pseudonocardiales bacterium]